MNVQFGDLASGRIPVYWTDTGFQTPPPQQYFPGWGIEMSGTHSAFQNTGLAMPMLWIRIEDSVVEGAMGWRTFAAWTQDPAEFAGRVPMELLFRGMSGFTNFKLFQPITDELWHGKFTYDVPHLTFDQGAFSGTGRLSVVDDKYDFEGAIDVPLAGLPKGAKVPVKKTADYGVFGQAVPGVSNVRSVGTAHGSQVKSLRRLATARSMCAAPPAIPAGTRGLTAP